MSCGMGAVCRLCRREGLKLFLKGDRCFSEKCGIERRSYPPGQHGQKRAKFSEYGLQLREKQKVRRLYGMGEKQFALFVDRAEKQKGATGNNLIVLLERRLDSVIYLLGFSNSRAQARQLIGHSHFLVNGKKVKTPSYLTKVGDVIEIREASRDVQPIVAGLENAKRREIPAWLELDTENKKGRVKILPVREDVKTPIEDHFIVEYYSR